jgi:hypothetical protein
MIGKIVSVKERIEPPRYDERYTKIDWDSGSGKIRLPRFSKLPGILGQVGETVEVIVRVIPKENQPK